MATNRKNFRSRASFLSALPIREIKSDLSDGKWAYFGQFLALASLLLPVALGKGSWLVPLAFSAALSTTLIPSITLAGRVVLQKAPILQLRRLVRISIILILSSFVIPTLASGLVFAEDLKMYLLCFGVINLGPPTYNLLLGLLISVGDARLLSKLRFQTNFLVFAGTVISLLLNLGPYGLAASIGLGFGIPSIVGISRVLFKNFGNLHISSEQSSYVSKNLVLRNIGVSTFSSIIHQFFALLIPFMGEYSIIWAVTCRLASGFETLGGVILGPIIESQTLRAIRGRSYKAFLASRQKRTVISWCLGVIAVIANSCVTSYIYVINPDFDLNFLLVLFVSFLYVFCTTFISVNGPLLSVLGYERKQIIPDSLKATPLVVAILAADPELLLLSIGLSVVLATAVLLRLQSKYSRLFFKEQNKSTIRAIMAGIYNKVFLQPWVQSILFWFDGLTVVGLRTKSFAGQTNLLYSSAFSGNIGDQAMADSFLVNVAGPKTVITGFKPSEEQEAFYKFHNAKILVIRNLVSAPTISRWFALRKLSKEILNAKTFSIVGADVMDGGYYSFESVARVSILHIAEKFGVPSRVLGFSWRSDAPHSLVLLLKNLHGQTLLNLRDPLSFQNLYAQEVRGIFQVSDCAFALGPESVSAIHQEWISSSHSRYVCLNVSALIEKRGGLAHGYRFLVDKLHDLGFRVVFLPHVRTSPENDDVLAVSRLFAESGLDSDLLISEVLSPQQVSYLARHSSFVITGRMHLALLALAQNTPAIVFETQSKVSGLYKSLELEKLVFDPFSFEVSELVSVIEEITNSPGYKEVVAAKTKGLKERALLNFVGLDNSKI